MPMPGDLAAPTPERTSSRRVPRVALGAGITVLAALAFGGYPVFRAPEHTSVEPGPNAVLVLDAATGEPRDAVQVGTDPGAITYADGIAWVANFEDRTVQPSNADGRGGGAPLGGIPGNPICSAAGNGALWVGIGFPNGQLVRIALDSHDAVDEVLGSQSGIDAIAIGEGAVWITNSQDNTLVRLDVNDPTQQRTLELPRAGPAGIAVAPGAIWVAERLRGAVVEGIR